MRKMLLRTQWISGLVLFLTAVPIQSFAQHTDVQKIITQAEEDVRSRHYQKAIDGYLEAHAIAPRPAYLYNIAVLYLARLDRPVLAWVYAVRFSNDARTVGDRKDAIALLTKIESRLAKTHGKVEIKVSPVTADVWLDQKNPESRVSNDVIWTTPGFHKILAEKTGFQAVEKQVQVELGRVARVDVTLEALRAWLDVECNVPACTVSIGSRDAIPAPVRVSLDPGSQTIRAVAAGHLPFETRVELKAGETRKVTVFPQPIDNVVPPHVADDALSATPDRTAAWATLGSGSAIAAAGIVLTVLGHLDANTAGGIQPSTYLDEASYNDAFNSMVTRAKLKSYTGYGLIGLGAVALGTGLYLYFTADEDTGTALLPAGPAGPGLTVMARW